MQFTYICALKTLIKVNLTIFLISMFRLVVVSSALGKWREEECKFEASLGYIVNPPLKKN